MKIAIIIIIVLLTSISSLSQCNIVNLDKMNKYDGQNRKTGVWISITSIDSNVIFQKYQRGLKNGFFKMYFKSGKLAEEGTYKNDKEHGEWKWYINGVLVSKSYYKNGIEIGHTHINPRHTEKLFE